jgi:hypothetical protein
MLATVLILNVLCLAAALLLLGWLRRPLPPGSGLDSFAQVLAAAAPMARRLAHSDRDAVPTACPEPYGATDARGDLRLTEESDVSELARADRLAIAPLMLPGRSAQPAAAHPGVSPGIARAIYAAHGRGEGGAC